VVLTARSGNVRVQLAAHAGVRGFAWFTVISFELALDDRGRWVENRTHAVHRIL